MGITRDLDHPVLAEPWTYRIIGVEYHVDPDAAGQGALVLILQRAGSVSRLKFTGVRELRIENGFPHATGGLFISDISARGWENCNVEVGDFEASGGGIYFFASAVEKV